MSSWVKLSRKLGTSAIAAKPEYLAVWVHLLISAAYSEGEILVGRQIVRLKPGQLVFGRHKFSEKTGVSENIVRSALKVLENLQQITIKSESKFSVITITNWAKYQGGAPADNQQSTSNAPATHHNKEVQEIQEEDQKHLSSGDDESAKPATKKANHLPVPYDLIFDAYAKVLPGKPQVRIRDDARKAAIKSLWARDPKFQSVEFWEKYFTVVSKSDFLMGSKTLAFDWLMKPANFKKVAEGNYS
jgi:hypothetical protein